jgi:hypothetical protein
LSEEVVKININLTDGQTYSTEINSEIWLKKINLSKISDGRGDTYRLSLFPAEMAVPLKVAKEAVEDLLSMLPIEHQMEILKNAEEQLR